MLHNEQILFAKHVAALIMYIFSQGYSCTLGEAFRTHQQANIYAHEHIGIINSLHCFRLAIDLNIFDSSGKYLSDSKAYYQFGMYWETLDPYNRWGGNFPRADGNHFERQNK